MAIRLDNGTILRNLEEQVLKNKEDIARHYEVDRALSNLGIKVVGQVTTADELPDPATYAGEIGSAYAVGNKEEIDQGIGTYIYYVWTRADLNAGEPNNYWLNVGKISIEGPRGPQGPKGDQGEPGTASQWYAGSLINVENPTDGDMFLRVSRSIAENGNVYRYNANTNEWVYVTNIQGPQGIPGLQGPQGPQGERGEQGPQGERGDVGGFINIWDILPNVDALPAPATLDNLTVAYLVGLTPPFDLYIQKGKNSDTAVWENTGPFNAGTLVQSGGAYLNIWNADTKMNKLAGGTSPHVRVLVIEPNNATNYAKARNLVTNASKMAIGAIPAYVAPTDTFKGTIAEAVLVSGAPTKPFHVANKAYVDSLLTGSVGGKIYRHYADFVVYDSDGNPQNYVAHWQSLTEATPDNQNFLTFNQALESAFAITVEALNEDGDIIYGTQNVTVGIFSNPPMIAFEFLGAGSVYNQVITQQTEDAGNLEVEDMGMYTIN